MLLRLSLLACFLTCVGCGSAVQKPTAAFKSANIGSLSEEGLALNFDLDVANPNSFALPISSAGYKLGFGGVPVIDGTAKPTGSIPASGSLPVSIPVSLSFEKLMSAEKAIVASKGNVPYEFDGTLEFSAGPLAAIGQGVKVPIKFSGVLPLRDAVKDPVALMKSPAGRKLLEAILGSSKLTDFLGR